MQSTVRITTILIPLPKYYIFYNGTAEEPDKKIMKLSEAFAQGSGTDACVECTAILLNINYGHNKELMDKCKNLADYALFIHYIRENVKQGMKTQRAVDNAIDRCIKEDVLKKFLVKSRAEVRNMVLSSFNRELYERDLRDEGKIEGKIEGKLEGKIIKLIEQVCKKVKKNKSPEIIADELEDKLSVISRICNIARENGYDADKIYEKIF